MASDQHSDRQAGTRVPVALITGAGRGLGEALAKACGADGMRVLVTDVDLQAARGVAASVVEAGGDAEAAALDVTDQPAVAAWVEEAWERHGGLDLLLNNAGVAVAAEAHELSDDGWDRVLDVNLHGVVNLTRAVYPRMVAAGRGRICNVASMFGLFPAPVALSYTTSKFAIVGLSLALRAEAAGLGVKVTAACPGFLDTDLFPADGRPPGKLVPAPIAAARILAGVRRNRAVTVFPWYVRALWWLYRLSPSLIVRLNKAAMSGYREPGQEGD